MVTFRDGQESNGWSVPAPDNNDDLVDRCRRGESQAFELLFRRHGAMLQQVAARLCRDDQLRRDVFQESARKIIMHFHAFNGTSAVTTWMYRITVNTALKMVRREQRYQRVEMEAVASPDTLATGIERRELVTLMRQSLAALPKRQRECASLFYLAEQSIDEIAATCAMKNGAVKTALFKARQGIIRSLERKGLRSCH